MAILFLLVFALFKKLITCNFAGYFFLPVFSQKKIPLLQGANFYTNNHFNANENVPTLIVNRLVKGLYIPLASLKISTI